MYYETSVRIAAAADQVWAVLREVERWPEWTPTVSRVDRVESAPEYVPGADGPAGELTKGDVVSIRQPRMPTLSWTVLDWSPGSFFSWSASSGGVTTVAEHRIDRTDDLGVTVTLSVRQSGLLAPVIGLLTGRQTRRYVDTEAQGLKHRCER
ncbi:SRPBCC family protein [Frankia sp. AgB1.9]|uniref:SRPBCC family protein n=1 Tax=unclassified Frankia TaxID=2632575 RepID=UPI0019315F64|nr:MULTISPECIES: SRPBCC family protein [unclassified Frankia]MBL7490903.1 SRPBCC family protein [Frankia sp. AgW1.1]MBL7548343.1 SRPBCC family protein [Frankia sp. AgB1.9]MBL7619051.1 SRPBCC family protein [Frankia sp. AgB1.8]